MKFDEVLEQMRELLATKGRVTYRALKVRLDLTDELLAACTEELIEAERVAADENGKVLVWMGAAPVLSAESRVLSPPQPPTPNPQPLTPNPQFLTRLPIWPNASARLR